MPSISFTEQVILPLSESLQLYTEKPAFCIGGRFYTYGHLAQRVNTIRTQVRQLKPKGQVVSLLVGDHIDTYASIIALWWEGLAYVPLHPLQPDERNLNIIAQTGTTLLLHATEGSTLTASATSHGVQAHCTAHWESTAPAASVPPCEVEDSRLAYILFTSGSTGTPKGVSISRLNLAAFIDSFWQTGFALGSDDRCLQAFDLTFDVSIQAFLTALLRGGCVYTIPYGQVKYIHAASLLMEQGITSAAMAPSMLTYLRPYFDQLGTESLRTTILTAEACPVDLIEDWFACAPNAEVYDFYGIKFLGHPHMDRLFLRNDFKGHPFRKDWKFDDSYSLEDDIESDYATEYSLDDDGRLVTKKHRLFDENDYVINIGPQHPSTHGVLRLQTVLDGETVKRIYPHLGYIHRGIEKMWEGYTYPQTLALTDRLNYLSAMMHRHALVGVIEEGMGIELTDRIKYVRTIMDELQRIDSHLLYCGCCAQDLGALTAFLYCMRDREHVLNVMEETTGGRLIQNYYRIGGLQDDIDPNFVENTKTLCKYLRPMIQEYMDVFGDNVITHNRFEQVGVMGREDCINYGVTGPAGRAAGWANDVRKNHPYDLYDKVEWKQITLTGCDSMDRYLVHIQELYQSLDIIEQLIDNIPAGDFYVKQKPIIKVPEGQWYFSVEGASGEFGVYLDSRGDKSPYRMKMRPMGLTLVGALDPMLRGQKIADLVTTGAAIDFVIPDIDR